MYPKDPLKGLFGPERAHFVQAYFPKIPGNFVQHNLANGCSHAQTEARYLIGTFLNRAPIRFFLKKMSGSRDRKIPL